MQQKKVTISNKFGIHARPASRVVETADRYASDIYFIRGHRKANGRSILDVMSIAAGACELTVVTKGADEVEALAGILKALEAEDI